jgi:hypothetical protein
MPAVAIKHGVTMVDATVRMEKNHNHSRRDVIWCWLLNGDDCLPRQVQDRQFKLNERNTTDIVCVLRRTQSTPFIK